MGNTTFYGLGKTVDTAQTITVVTQFITDDGTNTGTLVEIRRFYVQKGVTVQNSFVNVPDMDPILNSITENYCTQQKTAFHDPNSFDNQGGLKALGESFARGVVLVLSIADDPITDMLWLDSYYPLNETATTPGVGRGTCPTDSGALPVVEGEYPNAYATFSNIKFGPIGSSFFPATSSPNTVLNAE